MRRTISQSTVRPCCWGNGVSETFSYNDRLQQTGISAGSLLTLTFLQDVSQMFLGECPRRTKSPKGHFLDHLLHTGIAASDALRPLWVVKTATPLPASHIDGGGLRPLAPQASPDGPFGPPEDMKIPVCGVSSGRCGSRTRSLTLWRS
jgi:hypothetical protein